MEEQNEKIKDQGLSPLAKQDVEEIVNKAFENFAILVGKGFASVENDLVHFKNEIRANFADLKAEVIEFKEDTVENFSSVRQNILKIKDFIHI